MSYPINYPTPQGANVQIFNAPTASGSDPLASWTKPQGASFVWFTLIGPGGNSDGTTGGGSGAVTNFMCPAFLIPDQLSIKVGTNTSTTTLILYQGYTLLQANGATGPAAGTATTSGAFAAMGFYQSIAGHAGDTNAVTASSTTFLSGGTSLNNTTVIGNYGYSQTTGQGYFQIQPIIVGVGSSGGKAGIGCGGGGASGGGGNGMVVIITW